MKSLMHIGRHARFKHKREIGCLPLQRRGRRRKGVVHSVDVVHEVAVLALAFVFIRGLQALAEHYFPGSEPASVGRFLFGGPS
jgi:hypothetical protein